MHGASWWTCKSGLLQPFKASRILPEAWPIYNLPHLDQSARQERKLGLLHLGSHTTTRDLLASHIFEMFIPTVLEVTDLVAKSNPRLHAQQSNWLLLAWNCVRFLNLVSTCYSGVTNISRRDFGADHTCRLLRDIQVFGAF